MEPEGEDFRSAMELFFMEPSAERGDGWVSSLCLCRQELQDCFVGEIVGEAHIFDHKPHRLFATAMVALSGIELMARMAPPPSPSAGSGDLFVAMVTTYSAKARNAITEADARILLRFRNALSHTFGLYDEDKAGQHTPLWVYSSDHPSPVVATRDDGSCEICIESLVRLFLQMVTAFRHHLQEDSSLHGKFLASFEKHGKLFQRGPHVA